MTSPQPHDRSSSDSSPTPGTGSTTTTPEKPPALNVSMTAVVAGAFAAVTSALVGSRLGTSGTHIGAAIGVHPIDHDEIYYVLSGTGVVHSDGTERELKAGMAAWLYSGAKVGIRQTGAEPLVLIIAYPNKAAQ